MCAGNSLECFSYMMPPKAKIIQILVVGTLEEKTEYPQNGIFLTTELIIWVFSKDFVKAL